MKLYFANQKYINILQSELIYCNGVEYLRIQVADTNVQFESLKTLLNTPSNLIQLRIVDDAQHLLEQYDEKFTSVAYIRQQRSEHGYNYFIIFTTDHNTLAPINLQI